MEVAGLEGVECVEFDGSMRRLPTTRPTRAWQRVEMSPQSRLDAKRAGTGRTPLG